MKCSQRHMQSQENKIISLSSIEMIFDERVVLENINLNVYNGDLLAITGPNGGGKTTLLRIILKLLQPTSGVVTYWSAGQRIEHLKIGYLPQKNLIDSRFPITVKEVISSGLLGHKRLFHRFSEFEERGIDEMMRKMGVYAYANEKLGHLSGGQMQRALLGRALISNPEVLVLDEPLSYVDKRFEQQIYGIISDIAPTTTIVLVSHEMTSIAPMATRHIIVDRTIHDCHAVKHFVISECE